MQTSTQNTVGLTSDLSAELDRFKFAEILAKAKLEAEKRDALVWEIIKKLTYRNEPIFQLVSDNGTLKYLHQSGYGCLTADRVMRLEG